jgi:hypothetical protein
MKDWRNRTQSLRFATYVLIEIRMTKTLPNGLTQSQESFRNTRYPAGRKDVGLSTQPKKM